MQTQPEKRKKELEVQVIKHVILNEGPSVVWDDVEESHTYVSVGFSNSAERQAGIGAGLPLGAVGDSLGSWTCQENRLSGVNP